MAVEERNLIAPGAGLTAAPPVVGRFSDFVYQLRGNPATFAGLFIVVVIVLSALLGPVLARYDPYAVDLGQSAVGPSLAHPFGTDQYGEDILTRVVVAARLDLFMVLSAVGASMLIGVALGALAGFFGRFFDEGIMRSQDVLQAFPRFVFAMAVAWALGPGIVTVIVATAAINIPGYARLMRSLMLSVKETQFALAAVAVGNSRWRLLWRHLLPNCLTPIIVLSTLQCGFTILEAAGLSFIGLGVRVPQAEWGVMIAMGLQDFLQGHWWIYTFPGLAIAFAVLGFNLLGDGLQDILDPKRRRV
ncbi:MAG: ABC transporter permease [Chloroflexi bacterium]|nr:MAG: ABC transporter permease [Chloroflexota bacterium]